METNFDGDKAFPILLDSVTNIQYRNHVIIISGRLCTVLSKPSCIS